METIKELKNLNEIQFILKIEEIKKETDGIQLSLKTKKLDGTPISRQSISIAKKILLYLLLHPEDLIMSIEEHDDK